MTTPGRNEPCPCGSGRKYKHCHLKNTSKTWSEVAEETEFNHTRKAAIHRTFFLMNDDFKKNPNPGACHLLSSVMYVLLHEQGIESDLCIGEVQGPNGYYFDHSWIEIEGKVFDLAIQLTLNEARNAPVYAGIDLGSGYPSQYNYRFTAEGLGFVEARLLNTPFTEYMDGANHSRGWGLIEVIGRSLGLNLKTEELRNRYKETKRVLITS